MSQIAILNNIQERLSNIEELLISKPQPSPERPIPAKELEQKLNISRQQQIRLRKAGILNSYKLGGKVFFLMSEVVKALKKEESKK